MSKLSVIHIEKKQARIEERQAQCQMDEKYFCENAMEALNALEMELLDDNRLACPSHGWNNVNDMDDSSDKNDELMDLPQLYCLVQKLGCMQVHSSEFLVGHRL
ncbi:hypothetical protein ACH5RR_021729 [Cinchona calisaya]|uniref:Uncharacterized protein n=1 Tax=Cinchona calisaya TaxID=153742 RepID=A0ABD2ZI42_9GENT